MHISYIYVFCFFGCHTSSQGGFIADVEKCHLDTDEVSPKHVVVGAMGCLETSDSQWQPLLCFLAR